MPELPSPRILTVTELNRSIRGLLETEFPFVTVSGEISNLKQPMSGHIYFTLKDENAQLRAVLFKPQLRYLAKPPRDGQQVICRGRVTVYEQRGDYQLIVDYLEPVGAGLLQIAFEQLKHRLAAEGLFEERFKKKIPLFPEKIALITSSSGAAVHDFLKVANNRFPGLAIEILPVRVQGDGAANDIVEALSALNHRLPTGVIVLCRGGGSLEDLWAFNEERVARAIHASRLPVVTAIGHEIDFTIADFVADLRAPTPSAAAEMLVPDRRLFQERVTSLKLRLTENIQRKIAQGRLHTDTRKRILGDPRTLLPHFMLRLDHTWTGLHHAYQNNLGQHRTKLEYLNSCLQKRNPMQQILFQQQWFAELVRKMQSVMEAQLSWKKLQLRQTIKILETVSPLAVLGRGYAIVRASHTGAVIRSSRQTAKGQALEVILLEGRVDCEVTAVHDAE
ncbi:MAG: exodeoxyribonuclease VII large subunit [Deltaproteobacteria bacterium RIFOXYD12_FULL_57_12]|nr:MAG: exodeoxyribonuclease VII large subunit [Deltaproteobacteria bacterium RIFOXYD12_FULL_57_12]